MIPSGAQKGRHIDRWTTGLVTNRAATSMPFRRSYGAIVQYFDALIGGLNIELSPQNTLVRRPGWATYNNAGYSGTAQGFYSAILSSTQYDFLSTTTNVYQFDGSSMNSLYTKGTTAQTFFQQVGNVLFFSDGNANKKTWLSSGAFTVANNGIATPTSAPTVPNLNLYDTVGAVQYAHAWSPNAVYNNTTASPQNYFLLAPTAEIQWAIVPAGTRLISQSTAPNWATGFGVIGAATVDGSMTWLNCGPIKTWLANTGAPTYFNSGFTTSNVLQVFKQTPTFATTGSTSANWVVQSVGAGGNPSAQVTSSGYTGVTNTLRATAFGGGFAIPSGATVTGVVVTISRRVQAGFAPTDNLVKLVNAGVEIGNNKALAGAWPGTYTAVQYGSNNDKWGATLTPAVVNSGTFGVDVVANITNTPIIGNQSAIQYIQLTVFYTVSAGDVSGTATGTVILDSNGNLQRVKVLGTTNVSAPTWATTIGATTTDNSMTWECLGTGKQLPCLFGWTYAYGFHSSGIVNHLSTMSPQLFVNAPIIGTGIQIQGFGSDDTQVDRNDLYRTADGGPSLLYDQSTTNVNSATAWTINDLSADSDLNFLLIGPVSHANDPPPAGMTLIKYYMGRLWGAVGNQLFFSAGPDCINGDGNQAWPPANVFTYEAPITSINPTTQGLVVIDSKNLHVIFGGPQTLTFWSKTLKRNFGTLSPNCVDQEDDEIVMYTTQKQLFAFSPTSKNEVGLNVADVIASTFPASTAYLAIHRSGQDQGLFICDASANSLRFNMTNESWDTLATPATGLGPIASIDLPTSPTVRALVTAVGGNILKRDTTVFADAGAAYAAYGIVGSIVLSPSLEEPAMVESICLTSNAVGTALAVSVLPNETSGSFTSLGNSVPEPYQLPASSTIKMERFDWKNNQSAKAQLVKHVQVKVTLPSSDTVKNEIYTLSIR